MKKGSRSWCLVVATLFFCWSQCVRAEPPTDLNPELKFLQPGVSLTLVARHPKVVTPTGIDVDHAGRVWAVCSHTHFRPKEYEGPEHDEVIVLSSDGVNATRTVFYNKTDATMDLELGQDFKTSGWVYLAERDRVLRVRDTDNDGIGDQEEDIAVLETEADYPHNGLSGLAWHPSGDLIFALGENYWKPWTLTGPDNATIRGTGEGGIFRCRPDGKGLRRIASGFWNPFGVCVREDGTIFAAENDPGARPPCRLLHVVEGGDFGFQRRYGNSPHHPFVGWNGELRGTLPMLHSLGEAPCGISPLGNGLVVPSWTDNRIDFYPLQQNGASFQTKRISIVSGGRHFRPTCITQESATTFYLTDWVFGSYELHQRGRIWKLEIDPRQAAWLGDTAIPPANQKATLASDLRSGGKSYSIEALYRFARDPDAYIRLAAIDAIALRPDSLDQTLLDDLESSDRLSFLLAIRKSDIDRARTEKWIRHFLESKGSDLRFEALRWIADDERLEFQADVAQLLEDSSLDFELFEAGLATANVLSGQSHLGVADNAMLMSRIADDSIPSTTRAFALRLLDPTLKRFNASLWQKLYQVGDPQLTSELTRALVAKATNEASEFLLRIVDDQSIDSVTRADAVAGLSHANKAARKKLFELAASVEPSFREEALRSLRFAKLSETEIVQLTKIGETFPGSLDLVQAAVNPTSLLQGRPEAVETTMWQQQLSKIQSPVDMEAGRRLFHHPSVGACMKCHRHSGRGNVVGPDLSAASNDGDPTRLLRALLEPSRDVDPQYFPRMLVTEDGQVFTGILLRNGGGGREFYRDNAGRERRFNTEDIVQRKELRSSMMPDGLTDLMTDREIRDLLAFLDSRKTK